MSLLLDNTLLRRLFDRMFASYGPQHWWPAESPFEVAVGAVLTQNTAWSSVERAIANLKRAKALDPERIINLHRAQLAELLRPSGYFNLKADRLASLCEFILRQGGMAALAQSPTDQLRLDLLRVRGIGPETADDIMLYAFGRPVFVVDAYTRRLMERMGFLEGGEGYEELRHALERALGPDAPLFNEYHALIVRHAKEACRQRAACEGCALEDLCEKRGLSR